MDTPNYVKGSKVFFGRAHGERTLGEVVKVNRTTVKVKQLEARGTLKDYKVGTIWKVPFMFLTPAPEGDLKSLLPVRADSSNPERMAMQAEIERLRAENERLKAPKRPEAEIIREIRNIYSGLSPENLSCDGELPMYQVRRRAAAYRRQLQACFQELGRRVSEEEAYK
jgi:hypothetical protein